MSKFLEDLRHVINVHSQESGSNTPDFILAQYLFRCLEAYGEAVTARDKWWEFEPLGKLGKRILERDPYCLKEGDKFKIVATVRNNGLFSVHVDGRDVDAEATDVVHSRIETALYRLGFDKGPPEPRS